MTAQDGREGDPELMRRKCFQAVRAATEGEYEILGELAHDDSRGIVYLARGLASGSLLMLKHQAAAQDSEEFHLSVFRKIPPSLPGPGGVCESCGASVSGWARYCKRCGEDVTLVTEGADSAAARSEQLQAITEAAKDQYDVLGEMDRTDGGGIVYFARDTETDGLVTLRLQRGQGGRAGTEPFSLAVTRELPALSRLEPGSRASDASSERDGATALLAAQRDSLAEASRREGAAAAVPVAGSAWSGGGSLSVCPLCGYEYEGNVKFCRHDGAALQTRVRTDDLVGTMFAQRYRILRKLGEGGMGRVYLAEHTRMGRRDAVKIIGPARMTDPDLVSRFGREAANASRIQHPNVTAIYDFGETSDGIAFIAMEFVDGEPLSVILEREGPLSPGRAVEIARQTADGLSTAHLLGIVHRDLKPDNIMIVMHADGTERVKIVDFGISKAIDAGPSQQVTRSGHVIGTPKYMSPEQLSGDPLDGRSDIYSLGCVLYQMLTGEAAFSSPSGEPAIIVRLTQPPPRPSRLRPRVTKALDEVVVKALARLPDQRFQRAADLRDALVSPTGEMTANAAGDVTITAEVDGVKGAAVLSIQPALPRVVTADTTAIVPRLGEPHPPGVADRPTRLKRPAWLVRGVAGTLAAAAIGALVFRMPSPQSTTADSRPLRGDSTPTAQDTSLVAPPIVPKRTGGGAPPDADVARLRLSAPTSQLEIGETMTITPRMENDAGERPAGQAVQWRSSNSTVVSVNTNGVVTGQGEGTARISATLGVRSATLSLHVLARAAQRIVLTVDSTSLAVGAATRYTAVAYDAKNRALRDRRPNVTGVPAEAVRIADDRITARTAGRVTLTAVMGDARVNQTIIIRENPAPTVAASAKPPESKVEPPPAPARPTTGDAWRVVREFAEAFRQGERGPSGEALRPEARKAIFAWMRSRSVIGPTAQLGTVEGDPGAPDFTLRIEWKTNIGQAKAAVVSFHGRLVGSGREARLADVAVTSPEFPPD